MWFYCTILQSNGLSTGIKTILLAQWVIEHPLGELDEANNEFSIDNYFLRDKFPRIYVSLDLTFANFNESPEI